MHTRAAKGARVFLVLQHVNVPHYADKHWLKLGICHNTLSLISSISFLIPAGRPPKKTGIFFPGMDRFQRNTLQTLISSLCDLYLVTKLHIKDRGSCSKTELKCKIKKQHYCFKMFSSRVKNPYFQAKGSFPNKDTAGSPSQRAYTLVSD